MRKSYSEVPCTSDALYTGQLAEGACTVTARCDADTELTIRLSGGESLFVGCSAVRCTAPVYAGGWMEYSSWIKKAISTTLTRRFEAHKVIGPADRDRTKGLTGAAANVSPETIHPLRLRHRLFDAQEGPAASRVPESPGSC